MVVDEKPSSGFSRFIIMNNPLSWDSSDQNCKYLTHYKWQKHVSKYGTQKKGIDGIHWPFTISYHWVAGMQKTMQVKADFFSRQKRKFLTFSNKR